MGSSFRTLNWKLSSTHLLLNDLLCHVLKDVFYSFLGLFFCTNPIEDIKKLRLITAIKTPYLPDGGFDLEAYDNLIHVQIENGVEGVIVGGTTGEGQLMSF
ncbi:hypothetical protein L7F22_003856 [Adiantum nelumboides]|nr:hypothetical protein [Adiantum nelumboides]